MVHQTYLPSQPKKEPPPRPKTPPNLQYRSGANVIAESSVNKVQTSAGHGAEKEKIPESQTKQRVSCCICLVRFDFQILILEKIVHVIQCSRCQTSFSCILI